jgi:hypothetical protein
MDDIFQEFYGQEATNGYTAANVLAGFWISEKKAFENLVTTKEQDAHEFFQFLAEELHERNGDGKRPEVGSEHTCTCIIHQTFYGKMQSTTTCQHCSGVTNQVQSFLDLSLGLETLAQRRKKAGQKSPTLTLTECLDEEYIKSDKCEYRCHKCNSIQQARRRSSIKSLPNVLCIQLKVSWPGGLALRMPGHRLLTRSPVSRDLSTNKAGTIKPPRSTLKSNFHCNSTCCRTLIVAEAAMQRMPTHSPGPAHTTSSAWYNTWERLTPDTIWLTVVFRARYVV